MSVTINQKVSVSGGTVLRAANNLGDVADVATARDNLSVYSQEEVSTMTNARSPRQGLVGSGDQALVGVSGLPAFRTGAWTVSAWVNIAANKNYNGIFGSAEGGLWVFTNSAGNLYVGIRSNFDVFASFVDLGKNTLLTITNDGTTLTVYKNGVVFGTSTTINVIGDYTAAITAIGGSSNSGSDPINGTISPLIYNRALSASEITALFESGAPSASDYNTAPASNTSLITGANSTFSSDTGFWTKTGTASIGGGFATLANADTIRHDFSTSLITGQRYRVQFTVGGAGTVKVSNLVSADYSGQLSAGAQSVEFTVSDAGGTGRFGFVSTGSTTITGVTLVPIGLLLAPDAAQPGSGNTWYGVGGTPSISWTTGVQWAVPSSGIRTSVIKGTTTNDNAATGYVGEYVSSTVTGGSAVSLSDGTAANITSISLTAGDWDVSFNALFAGTPTGTYVTASVSETSATIDTTLDRFAGSPTMPTSAVDNNLTNGRARFSLSATTTLYFVARAGFSGGAVGAYGKISARRIR